MLSKAVNWGEQLVLPLQTLLQGWCENAFQCDYGGPLPSTLNHPVGERNVSRPADLVPGARGHWVHGMSRSSVALSNLRASARRGVSLLILPFFILPFFSWFGCNTFCSVSRCSPSQRR